MKFDRTKTEIFLIAHIMKNLSKAAAAAVGLLTLSVAVVPVVSAQDLSFLPGFSRANSKQVQENSQPGQNSSPGMMQGQMRGQKGPTGEHGENIANLTFEEQQQRMLKHLERAQTRLTERLETMDQNKFMTENVKNQLQDLIHTHLGNMASYKTQIEAASAPDALTAIREQMRADAKAMRQFIQNNRPSKEKMQKHWNNMSFEEKQERILFRLDNVIKKISEKQAGLSEHKNLPDAVMTRINKHLTEVVNKLNEVKTQVQNARSEADLEALKDDIGPGRGQGHSPAGMGQQGSRRESMRKDVNGRGLNQTTAE